MLKGKRLLDYTKWFSPNKYEKNDNTKIFSITEKIRMKKSITLIVVSIENLKTLKYYTFSKKHFFPLFGVREDEDEKLFK